VIGIRGLVEARGMTAVAQKQSRGTTRGENEDGRRVALEKARRQPAAGQAADSHAGRPRGRAWDDACGGGPAGSSRARRAPGCPPGRLYPRRVFWALPGSVWARAYGMAFRLFRACAPLDEQADPAPGCRDARSGGVGGGSCRTWTGRYETRTLVRSRAPVTPLPARAGSSVAPTRLARPRRCRPTAGSRAAWSPERLWFPPRGPELSWTAPPAPCNSRPGCADTSHRCSRAEEDQGIRRVMSPQRGPHHRFTLDAPPGGDTLVDDRRPSEPLAGGRSGHDAVPAVPITAGLRVWDRDRLVPAATAVLPQDPI
jgi:hypothetical protein